MKEKLIIKNFGPIKEAELELGRFTVLIGEQATGKSTVAKLLAVCRYFSYIVNTSLTGDWTEHGFQTGLSACGLSESVRLNSYIEYHSTHYHLIVEQVEIRTTSYYDEANGFEYDSELVFLPVSLTPKSTEFKNLLLEFEKVKPVRDEGKINFELLDWIVPTSFFQNDVAAVMDNPFYLPAERGLQSIFSLGKNSVANINDSLYNQFSRLDQIARYFRKETEIEPLKVVYRNKNGQGSIKKNSENDFFSLSDGASGYQSAIPIILATKWYSEIRKKKKTFLIEEPELNLFPSAQSELIKYLVANSNQYGNTMLLTTHSPYTLTTLNNLLYAYKVGAEYKAEVNRIIDFRYWLNINEVSAYRLMPDGTARSIVDTELSQLEVERIDEVSDDLSREWHSLADLKFSNQHEVF